MQDRRKVSVLLPEPVDTRRSDSPSPAHDRDADLLLTDTDEAAATEARARFREHGVDPIEPDDGIRRLLAAGEQVMAMRHFVGLDRRLASAHLTAIDSVRGDLYVTTARLVHVGQHVLSYDLDEIADSALAGERVLLILREGLSVALDAARPRLLRVQIAVARASRAGQTERQHVRPQPASR
jgi:hypothetical protein